VVEFWDASAGQVVEFWDASAGQYSFDEVIG